LGVEVGVMVDETGGDNQTSGVNRPGGALPHLADLDDPAALDADVRDCRGAAGSVDNSSTSDE
jgi:hypothetical protein